jgi:hypothetical protein
MPILFFYLLISVLYSFAMKCPRRSSSKRLGMAISLGSELGVVFRR